MNDECLSLLLHLEAQDPRSQLVLLEKKSQEDEGEAIKYILGNESFEKLASMSLIANITVYLTTKFRTLLFGSLSSLLGMGTVALTASIHQLRPSHGCNGQSQDCPQPKTWQLAILFMGLGLLSIGAGGIRPCNIAFGADQFDTRTAKGKSTTRELLQLVFGVTAIGIFITMDQMNTFGVLQALQMDRSIGPKFQFPPGWLSIASMLALATWIFTYEIIYLPLAKKFSTSPSTDHRFTMQQRINTGIVLSIVTMLVSGIVEEHRRTSALKHGWFVSPTSFALLLPQFFLTGFTESFSAVAIMEFFTMQMPESMRTVSGAIFFLSLSVSNYIGSFIVNMVHKATETSGKSPWVGGHDLNKNKLDCYYYIIAGLGAVNLVYFNLFARRYVLVSKKPGSDTGNTEVQLEHQNPIARDSSKD
ncbi:hypothetical protein M0R45_001957 [Rubus argutus]|uniref:Uncharacterized protein n=1 Tax=Rubus argutus TaxID=59490 RepID=A0AAW1VK87_RUBAR